MKEKPVGAYEGAGNGWKGRSQDRLAFPLTYTLHTRRLTSFFAFFASLHFCYWKIDITQYRTTWQFLCNFSFFLPPPNVVSRPFFHSLQFTFRVSTLCLQSPSLRLARTGVFSAMWRPSWSLNIPRKRINHEGTGVKEKLRKIFVLTGRDFSIYM